MPVVQIYRRRGYCIAILTCVRFDRGGASRIGICLRGTGDTLLRERPHFAPELVTKSQVPLARVRDCCILRTAARPSNQMLWIRFPDNINFHMFTRETLYLDAFNRWKPLRSRRQFISVTDKDWHSYGVVLVSPSVLTGEYQQGSKIPQLLVRVTFRRTEHMHPI